MNQNSIFYTLGHGYLHSVGGNYPVMAAMQPFAMMPAPPSQAQVPYPFYCRAPPLHQQTNAVDAYYRQVWARPSFGQKTKANVEASAANKKDEEEAKKVKEAEAAKEVKRAEATTIAAAGWTTMYFYGGEDTRQTMIRAGLHGVSVDVGDWKWVGEPGNGGFRICEVRKKKGVHPPKGSEDLTPALAWHLIQGVPGAPSLGYKPSDGTFEPPRPAGSGSGVPRYAGQHVQDPWREHECAANSCGPICARAECLTACKCSGPPCGCTHAQMHWY